MLTRMVLLLERAGSLIDLRRTQRRVAALLLNDNHVKLQKFRLRRRTLHQSTCHVCSRVDPNGLFRRPNDRLYHKGFFHSSDHLDNDLQTAIVHIPEQLKGIDCKEENTFYESEENQPEEISVTIRRGSKSTNHQSPFKREKSRDSYRSALNHDRRQVNDIFLQREISDSASKVTLPSIPQDRKSSKSFHTVKKSSIARTPSVELNWFTRNSSCLSETVPPGDVSDPLFKEDRITVIPTSFDDKSVISGLSTFNEGTTPSKSSNDIDSKIAPGEDRALQSKVSLVSMPNRRSVNPVDALHSSCTFQDELSLSTNSQRILSPFEQSTYMMSNHQGNEHASVIGPQLLIRENAMIPDGKDIPKRPNAGLHRERPLHVRSALSISTKPSTSGHQDNVDLLPIQGYDKESVVLEHNLESVATEIGNYSDSCSSKAFSEDATIIFSERNTEIRNPSGRQESLCRCSTNLREISKSQNVCKACGKMYRLDSRTVKSGISQYIPNSLADSYTRASSSTHCLSSRQQMLQHNDTNLNRRSKTTLDDYHVTRSNTRSRLSSDDGHVTRLTRSKTSIDDTIYRTDTRSQSTAEGNHVTRMNIRSKPVIDEDYMDLDSIIYEDDGRYWSSGDESASPNSWYRHAHPYPLVNPDIHKLVYIEALKASHLSGKKKLEDLDEMIRRPNVFSYIPLHPERNKAQAQDCGLRPCKSTKPKKGQLMKHIFGEIRLDDFYKGTIDKNKHDVIIEHASSEVDTDKNTSAK